MRRQEATREKRAGAHGNSEFGALAPGRLDGLVLAVTTRLPDTWLGLRLAILLRRIVTMRLAYPAGALDVERWDLRLRLHPRDNGCEKNLLFTPRMYEPRELAALAAEIARGRQLQRPFVFVDIGANVGLFSLFVAARSGGLARILAIEPEPGNLRRLNFNIAANPNAPIAVVPAALSSEAGVVAIELDRRDRGGSRTKKVLPVAGSEATVCVPARTLFDVVTAAAIDAIDAVKIDVEGGEDAVLAPFLRSAPPQLWPRLLIIEDSRDSWSIDLIAMLQERGYAELTRSKQNIILRRAADAASSGAAGDDATAPQRSAARVAAISARS